MGSTFGRTDSNATNDVLNGDTVATGTPGAKTMRDPNGGLDDSQIRNRKLAAVGAKTLGSIANPITSPMNNSGGGGGANFTFANNQPAYQAPGPASSSLTPAPMSQAPPMQPNPMFKQPKNPFFGY